VLQTVPLLYSTYCWPLIFLFAAPLFYVGVYNTLTFAYGMLWGFFAFTIHLSSIAWGIDHFAHGSLCVRLLPVLGIILYTCFHSAIWFAFTAYLQCTFCIKTVAQKLMIWVLTSWLFFIYVDQMSFWIFGRPEGHFLLNPLLPLTEQPRMLALLPYVGKTVLLLLFFCVSGAVVYWYIKRTKQAILLLIAAALPWLISLMLPLPHAAPPAWLAKVAPVQKIIPTNPNLKEQALVAQELFYRVALAAPEAQLIIMPESAYFCEQLHNTPSLAALWSAKKLERPLHIIVGAFRCDGPHYRNSLHWFHDGKLQATFDKRHAMPLTERMPTILNAACIKKIFFTTGKQITPSTNKRPLFTLFDAITLIPYICSELYFNDQPDDIYNANSTILATTNDLWCGQTLLPNAMMLAARFRAIQWQRNILYISYKYAVYFDKFGNATPLRPYVLQ